MSQSTLRRAAPAVVLLALATGLLLSQGERARADHTTRSTLQSVQDHVDDLAAAADELTPLSCGNSQLDAGEACDGGTAVTCQDLGFSAGSVTCFASCRLDTSACTP